VSYNVRLVISCPDRKGLIALISFSIAMHAGNVPSADQYVSEEGAGRALAVPSSCGWRQRARAFG
jgi:formyltetrahydrofolate deformylase